MQPTRWLDQKTMWSNGRSAKNVTPWPSDDMTVAEMGRLASEGDATALEVFRKVGEFIAVNIKGKLIEYNIGCLLFGGQISRSFHFMEDAVRKELSDIEGLRITTVSDFSNAAFKGLVEMLKK